MTNEVAALLREVIARPDDDSVRAVLADVLQAAGDPRGELIALQLLARSRDDEARARIKELIVAHSRTWLGWLADAGAACVFDRGFPTRLVLDDKWPADDPRWEHALTEPALATIEDLLRGPVRGNVYRRFLVSPAATRLRRVEIFDRDSLAGLAETTAAIEHVAIGGFVTEADYANTDRLDQLEAHRIERRTGVVPELDEDGDEVWDDDDQDPVELLTEIEPEAGDDANLYADRLWQLIDGMPTITSLGLYESGLERASRWTGFQRIRALTIATKQVGHYLSRWDDLGQRRLTLAPTPDLEPPCTYGGWDYRVEIIPNAAGAIARVSGDWLVLPVHGLWHLPAAVTRLEIERCPETVVYRIRDAVRTGLEVIEVPPRSRTFSW